MLMEELVTVSLYDLALNFAEHKVELYLLIQHRADAGGLSHANQNYRTYFL